MPASSAFRLAMRGIKWRQVRQAVVDGAGNTVGTVVIYGLVVLMIFLWYHKSKQQAAARTYLTDDTAQASDGSASVLTNALAHSKPAVAAARLNLVGTDAKGGAGAPTLKDSWT